MAHYQLRKMEVFRPSMYFILPDPLSFPLHMYFILPDPLSFPLHLSYYSDGNSQNLSEDRSLATCTSFSKFWSILTELITEKKRSIWRKIHGQFCYWLTYNSLQTKFVPFVVGKKASQNFMRKKDNKVGNKTGYKRKDKRTKKRARQKIEIK